MSERSQFVADEFQEKAIACRDNVVVTAGAGAGKTSVLAERFVRLIREGMAIDRVLVLTFTKKAARELYARIHATLSRDSSAFVREELARFQEASISTLDSFCSTIARSGSSNYGISPDFQIDDEGLRELSEREALSFMLEREGDEDLGAIVADNGYVPTWKNLIAEVGRSCSLVNKTDFSRNIDRQIEILKQESLRQYGLLRDACDRFSSLEAAPTKGYKDLSDYIARLFLALSKVDSSGTEGLFELLASTPRKPTGSHDSIELAKEIVDEIRGVNEKLPMIEGSLASEGKLRATARLLSEYQDRWQLAQRRASKLSFHDVAEMAVALLRDDLRIRRYYKAKYATIMIDEFQDNNELQKDLLYLLAERRDIENAGIPGPERLEPGSLLFVGDEKQSIYRFRGADVSVIRRLDKELPKSASGESRLSLRYNYRSAPALIDFFNATFSSLMPEGEEIEDFEARYEGLIAGQKDSRSSAGVSAWACVEDEDFDQDTQLGHVETEAFTIAKYIDEAVKNKSISLDGGKRTATYSDFAILMRSKTRQSNYERAFNAFGIPFFAQEPCDLSTDAPFGDFWACLRIALNPKDIQAYAITLRSPFVAISDELFSRIFFLRPKVAFEALADDLALSENDKGRFARGKLFYEQLKNRAGHEAIARTVEWLWDSWAYRFAILKESESHTYLAHYDYLLAMALGFDKEGQDLFSFVDRLGKLIVDGERLDFSDVALEREEGVQLMTIHKSKGLEFPVVIIPDCYNKGRGSDASSSLWFQSKRYGFCFRLPNTDKGGSIKKKAYNYFYELEKEKEKLMRAAELKRLLYVAATRAETRLVFTGSRGEKGSIYKESFFGLLAEANAIAVETIGNAPSDGAKGEKGPRKKRSFTEAYQCYERAETIERKALRDQCAVTELNPECDGFFPSGKMESPSLPIDPFIRERPVLATEFGTLCHSYIQACLEKRDPLKAIISGKRYRFADEALNAAIDSAKILAEGFFGSALGKDALSAREKECEMEFLLRVGEAKSPFFLSGKIDLVFGDGASLVLIDFKTDTLVSERAYLPQIEAYRRAIGHIRGIEPVCLLFYLRGGRSIKIDERTDLERIVADYREKR